MKNGGQRTLLVYYQNENHAREENFKNNRLKKKNLEFFKQATDNEEIEFQCFGEAENFIFSTSRMILQMVICVKNSEA